MKNYFRQELLSRAVDVEIHLGLVGSAAGFCILSPCTEVALAEDEDAFPMKSLRTGDIICCCVHVLSKAARCRIQ